MVQPPAYNREKNFALNSGRETDHSALNAELDKASHSINDIRTNLAILQADDGKLRPFVVTADSISSALRVSLVEGVVIDAQSMLDRSLKAEQASSASAVLALASEQSALGSALAAAQSAESAVRQVNSDWNATSGSTWILNKPVLAMVATSGSYNDLLNKPKQPEQVNADWNATSGKAQVLNKPVLATVATSGNYADLENRPVSLLQGMSILSNGAIVLSAHTEIYKVNITGATAITIDASGITGTSAAITFEVRVFMPVVYTITMPANVVWLDRAIPDLSQAGIYLFAFRSYDNGTNWLGNLQGKES